MALNFVINVLLLRCCSQSIKEGANGYPSLFKTIFQALENAFKQHGCLLPDELEQGLGIFDVSKAPQSSLQHCNKVCLFSFSGTFCIQYCAFQSAGL